jgi:polyisoprenoid-binding protein YceI
MKSPILLAVIVLCSFTFLKNQDWTTPEQHFLANPKTETQAQLIVFCETENQYFIKETLPKIKKYCIEKKITLVERKNTEGVPSELSSLPALVFQNGKNRSIYAARYAEFSTIENFIRTSRAFPQQLALNCKKDVLAYQNGRMKIATTLKITPLGGTIPSNFNAADFEKNTQKTIDEAMQNFAFQTETCLQKTDRMYYLDIHPYLDKTGKLFLSYELYSQFSCTVPVFSKIKTPLEGTLENSKTLLALIGSTIEKEIFAQLKNSTIGDAYSAISSETPNKTWQELGFSLSENQDVSSVKSVFENKKLTQKWSFAGAIDAETPAMAFHFQEPLDRYAGEVKQIKGTLQLNDNQQLTQGAFEVNTVSLTMGIDDFDHKVHEKYIKVGRFPVATFSFKNQAIALAFGKTSDANIVGDFTLMGKTIPMTMQAQLTPSMGSKGEMLLAVQTSFNLNIANVFGIKGPDGPDPANKTMQFFMNFFCSTI